MTKNKFMNELESQLAKIPSEERRDILQDFEEHFAIGMQEGKTEEEISSSLGAPNQTAKELVASYHIEQVEGKMTTGNIFRAVWAVIGLGFFNLVIVLGPFIALLGLVFAGWVTGLAFIVSPILFIVNVLISPEVFVLFELFLTVFLAGVGLLLAVLMFYITKGLTNAFVKYLKFNANLVKGGMKHA